jgi:hypothetical protein
MSDRFLARILFLCLFVLAAFAPRPHAARAQTTAAVEPELRIASPFAGSLWQIDMDREQKYLVMSASNETASVYDMRGGEDTRGERATSRRRPKADTFRIPSRDRQQTRSMGVAISPDGALVALAAPPLVGPKGMQKPGTGAIYLFDRVNKTIMPVGDSGLNSLTVPTRAPKLKFSPDGEYLVAMLSYGCGVRVWETRTWTLVGGDDEGYAPTEVSEKPYCGTEEQGEDGKDILSVYSAFDIVFREGDASRLWFTVLARTGLRHYRKRDLASGNIIGPAVKFQPAAAIGLAQLKSFALDSAGGRLAVGDETSMRVALLDADTLEPLQPGILEVPRSYIKAAFREADDCFLSQIAWLGQGENERLYAGGYLSTERLSEEGLRQVADASSQTRQTFGDHTNNLARWDLANPQAGPQFAGFGTDTIMAIRPLADGGRLAVGAFNALGLMSIAAPEIRYIGRALSLDFRFGELAVSSSGDSVRVTNYEGSAQPVVATFHVKHSETELPRFIALPRNSEEGKALLEDTAFQAPAMPEAVVGGWQNWTKSFTEGLPRFFDKELNPRGALFNPEGRDKNDWSRSVAVSPDGKQVLWGSSNALRLVENGAEYAEVTCSLRMKTEATLVAFARGGELAITAHSDGSTRWFEISKDDSGCRFSPRLTVYAEEARGNRWVWAAYRPDGTFYSPDLQDKFLGWQFTDAAGQVRFSDLNATIRKFFSFDIQDAVAKESAAASFDMAPIKNELEAQQLAYRIQLADGKPVTLTQVRPIVVPIRVHGIEEAGAPMEAKFLVAGLEVPVIVSTSRTPPATAKPSPTLRFERSGDYWVTFNVPRKVQTQKGPFRIGFNYERVRLGTLPRERSSQEFDKFEWQGPTLSKQPKRTFAVLAGFSGYNSFDYLKFAHKDAIDMAQILLADFRNELQSEADSHVKRDTWQLKISLFLSYAREEAAQTAILLDSLRTQAQTIRELTGEEPLEITEEFVSSPSQAQPDKGTRNFKTEILNKLGQIARAPESSQYRDAIVFYFSGHGVSETRGKDTITALPIVRDYLLAPGSAGLGADSLSVEHALESSEIASQLLDANAEKIIIIDACRNLRGGSDKLDPNVFLFDAYQRLRFASIFLSANLGETSKVLPYSKWPQQYSDLYDTVRIPDRLAGNSLFTHIVLQALICKESALGKNVITAQGLDEFIFRYLEVPNVQLNELRTVVEKLPAPKVSKSRDLFDYVGAPPIEPWFRMLAPAARKCMTPIE